MAERVRLLSAQLLASPSATRTLQAWCEAHGIGGPAGEPITARRSLQAGAAADEAVLEALDPAWGEALWLRRVRLLRGGAVLSEAENWFCPERLPGGMRHILETTTVPFGIVVEPLRPTRRTVFVEVREVGDAASAEACVLEHRAVVSDGAGRPIAAVRERYAAALVLRG